MWLIFFDIDLPSNIYKPSYKKLIIPREEYNTIT